MNLSDFPQPSNNNGRGVHGTASNQRFPDPWDLWLSEFQKMGLKWIKLLDDGGSNFDFSQQLLNIGVMPIVRLYIDAPNPGRITDYTHVDEVATIRRYVAGGVRYFEFNNEPNLPQEWQISYPSNAPEMTMDNWLPDAELVISLGGLPAFPALSPTLDPTSNSVAWYRRAFAYLKSQYAERAAAVFTSGVWLSVHPTLLNHPLDYPYDSVNQAEHPGATVYDDDCCLLGYRVPVELLKETFGLTVPVIATEGGVPAPGSSGVAIWDTRYAPITKQSHATNTVELFQWVMDESPEEFFGFCPWMLSSGGDKNWEYDGWYRRSETLPVVAAIKAMESYAKKNPESTTPTTPSIPSTPVDVETMARKYAWNALNIAMNAEAALYKKAKELGLGRPVTNEIYGVLASDERYVVQGFEKAILYVKEGDWDNIQQSEWL